MDQRDEQEFAEYFTARREAVRRTAFLLCGDWHRADDLAQTAFAKLYVAWPRLRDVGAVDAFLRRTLLNAYLDETRRAWRREHPTEVLPEREAADGPSMDDRLVLLAALAAVPPRQRACLVLRFFEDCSVEQTAVLLRCSAGTVKSSTARGLDTLRQVLGGSPDELVDLGKDALR